MTGAIAAVFRFVQGDGMVEGREGGLPVRPRY